MHIPISTTCALLGVVAFLLSGCDTTQTEDDVPPQEKTVPLYDSSSLTRQTMSVTRGGTYGLWNVDRRWNIDIDGRWGVASVSNDTVGVFDWTGDNWTEVARLSVRGDTLLGNAGHRLHLTLLGQFLAVSGNWIFMNANFYYDDYYRRGTQYAFMWDGVRWVEQQQFLDTNFPATVFGLDATDDLLVYNYFRTKGSPDYRGKAFYEWTGSGWSEVITYERLEGLDSFIEEPNLLIDRNQMLRTGPFVIRQYQRTEGGWYAADEIFLAPAQISGVGFGADHLLVGAGGTVYALQYSEEAWRLIDMLEVKPEGNHESGFSIATDGDFAAVGVPEASDSFSKGTSCGAVYLYERVQTNWVPVDTLTADAWPQECVYWGSTVALDADRLIVGGSNGVYSFHWSLLEAE